MSFVCNCYDLHTGSRRHRELQAAVLNRQILSTFHVPVSFFFLSTLLLLLGRHSVTGLSKGMKNLCRLYPLSPGVSWDSRTSFTF